MLYIAAIDIGSNAIRLAIANCSREPMHISYRSREPVRLGSSVFSTGMIDDGTFEELRRTLAQFSNQMGNHNVKTYRAVATSAMREAKNNQEVIARLHELTGVQVEIISGDEEAQLVQTAIAQKIDLANGNHLLIDIGGGSIELIAMVNGKVLKRGSFVIGMVRVLELHKKQKIELEEWFPAFMKNEINDFFEDLPPLENAIGTGGSMDRFIKLKSFVSNEPGAFLEKKEMRKLYEALKSVSYNERLAKFALRSDRADVIIPAAIATNEILRMARCERIYFPEVGLKDGILYDLASRI